MKWHKALSTLLRKSSLLLLLLQVNGFLQCIRDAAKQVADQAQNMSSTRKDSRAEEPTLPKNHSSPNLSAETACDNLAVTVFPLWYVGRVIVSHRQAPPTLIDELVERFQKRSEMSDLEQQLKAKHEEQKVTPLVVNDENHANEHQLAKKTKSLDSAQILQGEGNSTEERTEEEEQGRTTLLKSNSGGRPRSASDGDKKQDIYSSKINNPALRNVRTHSRNSSFSNVGENRNILFKISVQSVACLSVSSKAQLMERRLREVSFCQQVCFCIFIYLFIYLFICLFIYLFITTLFALSRKNAKRVPAGRN